MGVRVSPPAIYAKSGKDTCRMGDSMDDNYTIDLLKKSKIFSDMSVRDLQVIASYSKFVLCREGEFIFDSGQSSRGMFVIDSGEIIIQKIFQQSEMIDIARFVTHESFGEMELFRNHVSSVRAVAHRNSRLLNFPDPNVSFDDIRCTHPALIARILRRLINMAADRLRSTNQLITKNSRWVQELRRQIFMDKLTGLLNHRYFDDRQYLDLFVGDNVSLLMIKPDDFKAINDTYGHELGDKVLELIARQIASYASSNMSCVRYRSSEFVVIMPKYDREAAQEFAEQLHSKISSIDITEILPKSKVILPFSIGMATYPVDTEIPSMLVKFATKTLFAARNDGGDKVYSYNKLREIDASKD